MRFVKMVGAAILVLLLVVACSTESANMGGWEETASEPLTFTKRPLPGSASSNAYLALTCTTDTGQVLLSLYTDEQFSRPAEPTDDEPWYVKSRWIFTRSADVRYHNFDVWGLLTASTEESPFTLTKELPHEADDVPFGHIASLRTYPKLEVEVFVGSATGLHDYTEDAYRYYFTVAGTQKVLMRLPCL